MTDPSEAPPTAPRLRILHLGFEDHRRPGSGGGAARNREVNRRLAARHDITVLTTSWHGAQDRVEDGVRYVHIGLPLGYATSLLSYFAVLPFAARRHPADLVVEDFAAPFSSVGMPLWSDRPTLGVVQWLNSRDKQRQYRLPFAVVERTGTRSHSQLVAVSGDLRDRLLTLNPRARVDIVPNGVDRLAFALREPRGDDVVFLGRLERAQKGLDLLLEAYALAAPRIGGRLVLAGVGPDRGRLTRQAARLGLADRVHFRGPVSGEDKYRLLAGARLVAMPSRYETFGMVALEALASGTPVLAYDIPCLREVVPEACGVLVGAFDVDGYAAAMAELYADRERVERLGAAGRLFARDYDWDGVAAAQERVYLRVARPVAAPAPVASSTAARRVADRRPLTARAAGGRLQLTGLPDGPLLVLSPHLDDAVLSCGALLASLAPSRSITVATVFTEAGPGPHTLSAQAFLRQCGAADAQELFARRRQEDAEAMAALGVEHVHLGLPDALFRRPDQPGRPWSRLLRRPAELHASYPTYRRHVVRGPVARADAGVLADLGGRLADLVQARPGVVVLAPVGVGNHVDHRIVRLLAEQLGDPVLYADQPYALRDGVGRVDGLRELEVADGLAAKSALVGCYRTQVSALFRGGRVPALPETYLVPAHRVVVQ